MVLKLWFPCQQYQHYMMHLLPRATERITRVFNTMEIFLSQSWRPEAHSEVASRATFLASSSFLMFPAVFGVSQAVDSSLWTSPQSSHSILSVSVSCIYFSYEDSNPFEFIPQPKPEQSHLSPSLSNPQSCYFQSGYIVSTAIPH